MGKVVIEVPWDIDKREAVDAIASLALKRDHRVYGEISKKIADAIRPIYEKNNKKYGWNALWAIATNVAKFIFSGYSDKTIQAIANAIAQEYGVPAQVANDIVVAVKSVFEEVMIK